MDGEPSGAGDAVAKPRPRTSVAGALGEVLVTVGVVVLLYVVWQLWIGDLIIGAQNNAAGQQLSQEWTGAAATASPTPGPSPSATPDPAPTAQPVILPQPADRQVFGVMYVPRFGANYAVKVAGGVTKAGTLDTIGIGHYPDTQMPGQVGNFALAAHRTTFGAPFADIASLHVGDAIVIQTKDGWYTYRFRTLEYVKPTAIDVLKPAPQLSATVDGTRYLTMTSCSPKHSNAERIIAYSVFESFTPTAAGRPASLAGTASS